jgi:uncharacterized protein YprB with RNaseH-like and TPR domain
VAWVEGFRNQGCIPVLVAHNGRRFDVPKLRHEMSSLGMPIPADWAHFDTFLAAKKLLPKEKPGRTGVPKAQPHFLHPKP